MPRNVWHRLVFMGLTVLFSVHIFVIYNVAIFMGGMSNRVFQQAERLVPIEFAIAFLLESLVVWRLANRIAFRMVDPSRDRPAVVVLAITCATVAIMCPTMSLAATILYDGFTTEFFAQWFQKVAFNFPLAFFSQIFLIGPLVRLLFGLFFGGNKEKTSSEEYA